MPFPGDTWTGLSPYPNPTRIFLRAENSEPIPTKQRANALRRLSFTGNFQDLVCGERYGLWNPNSTSPETCDLERYSRFTAILRRKMKDGYSEMNLSLLLSKMLAIERLRHMPNELSDYLLLEHLQEVVASQGVHEKVTQSACEELEARPQERQLWRAAYNDDFPREASCLLLPPGNKRRNQAHDNIETMANTARSMLIAFYDPSTTKEI